MMNGRKPAPIFSRFKPVSKSRFDGAQARKQDVYWQKHLKSIKVNEEYRGKLKGRVVCIIDDYLTQGNTFEALRNLLISCKVKKIICIAIGKFLRGGEYKYTQKKATVTGDVYSTEFTAEPGPSHDHVAHTYQDAKRSLQDLKALAVLLN